MSTLTRRAGSWVCGLLLGGLTVAQGQVQVSLRALHTRYLQYEPMTVEVTVRNEMGTPIVLDNSGEAVFAFDIEESPGEPLSLLAEGRLLPESWTIEPWKTGTRSFNLIRHYPIRNQGPHRILARVTIGKMDFLSNRIMADIVPGMEIANTAGMTGQGDRRVFSLRTLIRDRFDHVFLLIQDEASGSIYEAQDLGTLLRFYPPQIRVSSDATIHVLHQSAPTRFTHSVTTMDGRPVSTRFYSAQDKSAVALVEDRRGRLRPEGVGPYTGDPTVAPVRMPESVIPKDGKSVFPWVKDGKSVLPWDNGKKETD